MPLLVSFAAGATTASVIPSVTGAQQRVPAHTGDDYVDDRLSKAQEDKVREIVTGAAIVCWTGFSIGFIVTSLIVL